MCHAKSLDFIPVAMGALWTAFKQGSDILKTLICDISQLAGNRLNIQGGFMRLGRTVRS